MLGLTVPWRLSWARKVLPDRQVMARYFEETSEHGRLEASLIFARCFAMRPRSTQTLKAPVRLKVSGVGTIEIHNFADFCIFFDLFVLRTYDLPEIEPPETVVDIGANIGMYTLRARKLYPSARIISYEPVPLNYRRLTAHVNGNGLNGVTLVNKGVGGRARQETIHLHPLSAGGHSIYSALTPDSAESVRIDLEAISDVVAAAGNVDLLKLDCEGAENEIVMSLTEAEARRIRRIIIETTFGLYEKEPFLGKLTDLGYRWRWHNMLLVAERDAG